MAVITAGLYRLDLFQTYFDETLLNTFWYRSQDDRDDLAADLALVFEGNVLGFIAAIQSDDLTYDLIKVTPIFGTGIEFTVVPSPSTGTKAGQNMSTFFAASIKLNRASNELRSGWKRFAGLIEEDVGATQFGVTYFNELSNAAGALDNVLDATPFLFDPVIVRKPFSTKANTPDWEYVNVGTASAINRPTTQNSRKTF